jgi:hypothetical protein
MLHFESKTVDTIHKTDFITPWSSQAAWVQRGGPPSKLETNWVLSWLPHSSICVDIGAHIGTWTTSLGRHCKFLHSFEPNYKSFLTLAANVMIAEVSDTVQVYNESGEFLDRCQLPEVDFVRISASGNELVVLKGAVDTIQRCKPKILIESRDSWREKNCVQTRQDLFAYVNELGYIIHPIHGNSELFLMTPR